MDYKEMREKALHKLEENEGYQHALDALSYALGGMPTKTEMKDVTPPKKKPLIKEQTNENTKDGYVCLSVTVPTGN